MYTPFGVRLAIKERRAGAKTHVANAAVRPEDPAEVSTGAPRLLQKTRHSGNSDWVYQPARRNNPARGISVRTGTLRLFHPIVAGDVLAFLGLLD